MKRVLATFALLCLICAPSSARAEGDLAQPVPAPSASATTAVDPAEEQRLRALAREYETITGPEKLDDRGPKAITVAPSERTLVGAMFQTILVLGGVVLLVYLLLGKLLPRFLRIDPPVAARRIMQVIDRLPIDTRRSLMVLRIGEKYYLVGAADSGVSLLSRLESDDIDAALRASQAAPKPLSKLSALLNRTSGE